jgi:hypothetical protein
MTAPTIKVTTANITDQRRMCALFFLLLSSLTEILPVRVVN